MPVKSHTQLNKSIMKRFAFKGIDSKSGGFQSKVYMTYCLDLKNEEIREEKINELGTVFDYFSDSTEEVLSNAEARFSEIMRELANYKSHDIYDFSKNEAEIKRFLYLILCRSKRQLRDVVEIAKERDYKDCEELIDVFFNEDTVALAAFGIKDNVFANYGITLFINDTDKNFVIPKCGYYFWRDKEKGFDWIIFPINPKRAILLFNKDNKFHFKSPEGDTVPLATPFAQHILALNEQAVSMEIRIDNDFVISQSRSELEILLKTLKEAKARKSSK